jgi:phosphate transport system protein
MDSDHIVKSFDEELARIDQIVAEMGGLAESQLSNAVRALVRRDADLAQRVVDDDVRIDDLEAELDAFCMRLLALRQPMAMDLRLVFAGLKTAGDIERIGDYAKNVAKRAATLTQVPAVGSAGATIQRMGILVQGMIKNVLDAFVSRDLELAEDVRIRDHEVDQLHSSLFRELLTYMMEDPRNITTCTHLLFIAKNLERIGDHVTNIAEHIYLMVRGKSPEEDRPKGDSTAFARVEPDGAGAAEGPQK